MSVDSRLERDWKELRPPKAPPLDWFDSWDLTTRARSTLARFDSCSSVTLAGLFAIKGVGRKTTREIREAFAKRGIPLQGVPCGSRTGADWRKQQRKEAEAAAEAARCCVCQQSQRPGQQHQILCVFEGRFSGGETGDAQGSRAARWKRLAKKLRAEVAEGDRALVTLGAMVVDLRADLASAHATIGEWQLIASSTGNRRPR